MNCSYLGCKNPPLQVCTCDDQYASCTTHEVHHREKCYNQSISIEEYKKRRNIDLIRRKLALQNYQNSLICFSATIIKMMKKFTSEQLENIYSKTVESEEKNISDLLEHESEYLGGVLDYLLYFQRFLINQTVARSKTLNGDVFQGIFDDDLNGFSSIEYESGAKYKGFIFNSCKTGLGFSIEKNKESYFGEYHNSERSGFGVNFACTQHSRDSKYSGFWKNDKKQGYGKLYIKGNFQYEGMFIDDFPHGIGKIIYHDGLTYQGSFQNGQFEGKGTLTYPNNDSFEGNFSCGMKNGFGVFKSETAGIYEGDWLDDKKHGQGMMIYHNGLVDIGTWLNDQYIVTD